MKNGLKWILGGICLCLCIITISVFIFHEPILSEAGRFMAPTGDYKADVAILEGTEIIGTGAVMRGIDLLLSGKVKCIIIVLHNIAPAHSPYGINGNYVDVMRQKFKDLGLEEMQFQIIVTPVRHPITLREAEVALETLSNENVQSAILLSPGFHTRRSYLVYQHVGIRLQIKIFPSACFIDYQLNAWWVQESAVRDFIEELLKLGYYLAGGYIPFKFSY
jgi:hypothetical protein